MGPARGSSSRPRGGITRKPGFYHNAITAAGKAALIYNTIKNDPRVNAAIDAAKTGYKIYQNTKVLRSKSGVKRMATYDQAVYSGRFNRKVRKSKMEHEFLKKGFVEVKEQWTVQEETDSTYVGHGTIAVKATLQIIWASILKKFFKIALNWDAPSTDAFIPNNGSGADLLCLVRTNLETGADQTTDFSISYGTTPGTSSTIESLAVTFAQIITPWLQQDISERNWILKELRMGSGTGTVNNIQAKLDLYRMKIHYFSKSDLKVQNASNAVGADTNNDNALDVNNVPLQGKLYFGKGCVAQIRNPRNTATATLRNYLGVEPNNGIMFYYGDTDIDYAYGQMREPPHPSQFINVKGASNILLQPGSIKRNTLFSKYVMYLNSFHNALRFWSSTQDAWYQGHKTKIGKFAFVGLEKLLTSSNDKIKVRAEIELKHGAYCSLGAPAVSVAKYKKGLGYTNGQANT